MSSCVDDGSAAEVDLDSLTVVVDSLVVVVVVGAVVTVVVIGSPVQYIVMTNSLSSMVDVPLLCGTIFNT